VTRTGLQREDLWRYFGLAKAMSERIREGSIDTRMFRVIKMDRVYEEVEEIKRKAESAAEKKRKSV
jgi:predicted transcriptional regulator